MTMNKNQAKSKIAIAIDMIVEVNAEIGATDASLVLTDMEIAGMNALRILTLEAQQEKAEFLTTFRSMHA